MSEERPIGTPAADLEALGGIEGVTLEEAEAMAREAKGATESVWVVTAGEYSDYRVVVIANTEELAKALVDSGAGDDYHECQILTAMPAKALEVAMDANFDAEGNLIDESSRGWEFFPVLSSVPELRWSFSPGGMAPCHFSIFSTGDVVMMDGGHTVPVETATPEQVERGIVHHLIPGHLRVYGTDIERVRKVYGELKFRIQSDPVWRSEYRSGR